MRALPVVLFLCGCLNYDSLSSGLSDRRDLGAVDGSMVASDLAEIATPDSASSIDFAVTDAEQVNVDMAKTVDLAEPAADLAQPAADLAEPAVDLAQPPADMTQLPATCAEINTANPASNDGNFTLYFQHNASKSWIAWCKGMGPGGSPIEYLPLPQGKATNCSVIGASLPASGEYTKIRIDPVTLKVAHNDGAYNTVGSQSYGCTVNDRAMMSNIPYAYANSYCGGYVGEAKIDLRGTPFKVAPAAFTVTGAVSIVYSENDQMVVLTATSGGKAWPANGLLQLVL